MNPNNDPSQQPVQEVPGAFEIFDGQREELITLTHEGHLLKAGDQLPTIPGLEAQGKPFIIHTVNAIGTETCDSCVDAVESFYLKHGNQVPVYSLTKQSQAEISEKDTVNNKEVRHPRLTISQETAIGLGVALAPGKGADTEFWPNALRRMVAVVNSEGQVIYVEEPDDQEQEPDFDKLFTEALAAAS